MTSADKMTLSDGELVDAWLLERPATTKRAYRREIAALQRSLAGRPLAAASLSELRNHVASLEGYSARSRARAVAALKSFYTFHARAETILASPAAYLKAPSIPSDLAERILTEEDTRRLLAAAPLVEGIMLRLLYEGGLRASELCGLRWRDLTASGDGCKLNVTGKGGKVRTVLIPGALYGDLQVLEADEAGPESPVFPSISDAGRAIGPRELLRTVKRAAKAAGLSDKVSSHWLRHCHASHAIDAGAPITLVRDTLGHSNLTITNRYAHARPNDGSARFLRSGA